ncbi:TMEM175 family protein [Novosphingobium sp. KACC 22771]|uniref:TMEM175 family protein n=1 Tax=Novosphingobium sp. KACC 22771 TaxID=3025670 RepID=UPI00236604BD|nr:TMEM175 family protein [Novosphingobium sp. KACC 22771]WDF71675.1 TMEM175 family protein [Novosphingobium sp. KACC 22771]
MSESELESRGSIGRIEAFSDGVLAIIVTIMVLELHAPAEEGWQPLLRLWPVFLAYVLSFTYVAIYWVNHHRLLAHARRVTNRLVWNNMGLLFTLSLVPFATAYLGEHHFSREATMLYLAVMLTPAVCYLPLQADVRRHGHRTPVAEDYYRTSTRKGTASTLLYLAGFGLALWHPWAGIACAGAVAVLWFLPAGPVDRLFDACGAR